MAGQYILRECTIPLAQTGYTTILIPNTLAESHPSISPVAFSKSTRPGLCTFDSSDVRTSVLPTWITEHSHPRQTRTSIQQRPSGIHCQTGFPRQVPRYTVPDLQLSNCRVRRVYSDILHGQCD